MLEKAGRSVPAGEGVAQFLSAGTAVAGEYHCSDCGYGVTLRAPLPRCPMCRGELWEPAAWSPFTRAKILQ